MQNFVYALLQVQASYRQAIQKKIRVLNLNITFEMLQVMRSLSAKDKINQQELASLSYKDKSSLSYLLNNMEKRGLIYRQEDEKDKRNKLIILTQLGRDVHETIKKGIEDIYLKVEKEFDSQKLNFCVENMVELSRIISK